MSVCSVPPGVGAGGALVLVLSLAAFVVGAGRGARPLGRASLYLLLGAALFLLAGAPPQASDTEDRRQAALIVALLGGGMAGADLGKLLRRLSRRP